MIDATGTPVIFNKESAIVIARKEVLGPLALNPDPEDSSTVIGKVTQASLVQVYPNPTNGEVTIQLASNKNTTALVRLYTVTGVSVRLISQALYPGANNISLDMNHLPAGVYTANIIIDGQSLTTKIVKK